MTTTHSLNQLKKHTTLVADTSDLKSIATFKPKDATTNPTLIYQATQMQEYQGFIKEAITQAKKASSNQNQWLSLCLDKLYVKFGKEILKLIDGRVSTEVDARYSFDTQTTLDKARNVIKLYEEDNIDRSRILIKIASTWEGIEAAKQLEKEGIHCNMTLLFSFPQALYCAQVGATLISPFVGRIFDWYCKNENKTSFASTDDPGVKSVKMIYHYYKKFDYQTEIMGASFRNIDQIIALSGCDLLTISPSLLKDLKQSNQSVKKELSIEQAKKMDLKKEVINEKRFRWMLNEDAMAIEKLSEGIRKFAQDTVKLEKIILEKS